MSLLGLRAVLFDLGGTLDGDGHWLDRFRRLYAASGVPLPHLRLRAAFDDAEGRAAIDQRMVVSDLEQMLSLHVGWQLESLRIEDDGLRARVVRGFVAAVRSAAASHVGLLADLHRRGLRLGVVSNGCGNVQVLCEDLGYGPYLSLVVDSWHARVAKPDPAIYARALEALALPADLVLMVGDSLERDMIPAKSLGIRTAWLQPTTPTVPVECLAVDMRLQRLGDLRHLIHLPPSAPS